MTYHYPCQAGAMTLRNSFENCLSKCDLSLSELAYNDGALTILRIDLANQDIKSCLTSEIYSSCNLWSPDECTCSEGFDDCSVCSPTPSTSDLEQELEARQAVRVCMCRVSVWFCTKKRRAL